VQKIIWHCTRIGQSSDNRTVALNETLIITVLHCNICCALRDPKSMFSSVNSIILTKTWALIASSFVQLVVTAMHQIFGVQVVLYTLQHNKYTSFCCNFMLKCLFFLFFTVTWLQCITKALNVACGNSFSNQWVFTTLETEVVKYDFLNFYISETMPYILLKFVQ